MTTEEETISGLGSETEQSFSKDFTKKRPLNRKEEQKLLKKRFRNEGDTDEVLESENFDESQDLGYTESSRYPPQRKNNNKRKKKKLRNETGMDYLDMEADSDEGEDDTLNDQSEEAELTKVQQDRMFNEHFNQTGTESYKDNYYRDLYNQKPEDIAKRYEGSEEILDDTEYPYDEEEQQRFTILPSLRDPKLFRVRCRIGQEREACIC